MIQRIETFPRLAITSTLACDVALGLARRPKSIPSTHFYDERGSELFEQITTLPEYYLTACEREILQASGREIAALLPRQPLRVVELGAGDGHKTELLLGQLLSQGFDLEYLPIDICARSVEKLVAKLASDLDHPRLNVSGRAADYLDALAALRDAPRKACLVLFLGSSIGNFTLRQSRQFLHQVRARLRPGDQLLIGFDLKKDLSIIERAYDDAAGVTREFNFNLLDRINRELDAGFERDNFMHYATYNLARDCMESWLVSRCEQQVTIQALNCVVPLGRCEGIRVERSHKYDFERIRRLASASGFAIQRDFLDRRGWFVDSLWQAE